MNRLAHEVVPAKITAGMSVEDLVESYSGCAFGAGRLAQACDVYEEMVNSDATKFFGLAGAMVPAGMRTIVRDLIADGYIDVLVTTGANLVHDIVESMGLHHYRGTDVVDDLKLKDEAINRIYDVYLPEEHFTSFEELMMAVMDDIPPETISISQFLTHIGDHLTDSGSILKTAVDNGVPVFCPAIQDSVIGLQAWMHKQTKPLSVDAFSDMKELMQICFDAKSTGALFVGGGVPKNYILQSMLVTPKEFDYAIQLTMDRPETGGLSGATLSEAQSWGKVSERARAVTVYADATITLPIIVATTRSRLGDGKNVKGVKGDGCDGMGVSGCGCGGGMGKGKGIKVKVWAQGWE